MKTDNEWISTKDRLPDENVSVLVFIPEEDEHITTGMWDVSKKWVLLDEYRVPNSEVTYWMYCPEKPEDRSYKPTKVSSEELETMSETISRLQRKIYQLEHKILELQNL